ncbi:hypothetical protein EE612_009780, partial [Oryza sativa]
SGRGGGWAIEFGKI